MPDEIYVFGSPDSLGDRGFTQTEYDEDFVKYIRADLAQPRAVEKVEREALQLEILSDFDSATQIEKLLILEVVDYLFGKGFIVAAQQKKAGEDPLAGTPDGVCS